MNLNQEEWRAQLAQDENAIVLDVRTPEEWAQGIIPDAVLLDIYQGPAFIEAVRQFDPSKSYYVYCKAGGRSQQACLLMHDLGFEKTYNLIGGMMEWDGDVVAP